MKKLAQFVLLLAGLAGGWGFVSSALADNIAPQGTGILGVKFAIDGTNGIPVYNSGGAGDINDGNENSRVDTYFPTGGTNNGPVSYAGIVWPFKRYETVRTLTLTLAAFIDGGWFGVSGFGPGDGGILEATNLLAPTVQISTNGGINWITVAATSDYVTTLTGFGIGGGNNPNPNPVTVNFTLTTPITNGIDGIRIIGENGGNSADDTNGFLGVFELVVNADASVDSDGDGFSDALELAFGSDPKDPNIFPSNFALIATGILGTSLAVDSGPGTETPLSNAGTTTNINDGNLSSRVDSWNDTGTDTASYVGLLWTKTLTHPLVRLELTMATFLDGGWFGPNNAGPGAGGLLNSNYLSEPDVQITKDGGATWTTTPHTSDYLTALNGHGIGGGAFPNPSSVTAIFQLTNSTNPKGLSNINGIRIMGSEGGTASGGFIGVFELAALVDIGDTDNNGLTDDWERLHFGHIGVNPAADPDSDGLTNFEEFKAGTDPMLADTDSDGLQDGAEVHTYHTDPLKADTDGDTVSDGDEVSKYHSNPLVKDSDGDGFSDGVEVAAGTSPSDATSFPDNFALIGTGIMGTAPDLTSGTDVETPLFHAGSASVINDGILTDTVDTYNGASADIVSYVGILWDRAITNPIVRLELTIATFFDGGWFGVNGVGPGSGGSLTAADNLLEPTVQTTKDGGTNWTEAAHTSDYLTAMDGHPLPAVDFGPATFATANFQLTTPATGVNGIRIIGSEGGTASGGFLGVAELAVHVKMPAAGVKLLSTTATNGQFQFQFDSRAGATHTVLYNTLANGTNWQTLTNITGDGSRKLISDPVKGPGRFYRVKSQ